MNIDSSDNHAAVEEADVIDFTPDPSQLGRPPREAAGVPRWLIAGLATTAILIVVLMLKPGPATAKAADADSADIAQPAHQDLFQLPEWHDDPADAKPAR